MKVEYHPIRKRKLRLPQCFRLTCVSKPLIDSTSPQNGHFNTRPCAPADFHILNRSRTTCLRNSDAIPADPPSAIRWLPWLRSRRFDGPYGSLRGPSPSRACQPLERSNCCRFFDMLDRGTTMPATSQEWSHLLPNSLQEPPRHDQGSSWLTGTALRDGDGVGMFSQT